jgi:hypothetical protein
MCFINYNVVKFSEMFQNMHQFDEPMNPCTFHWHKHDGQGIVINDLFNPIRSMSNSILIGFHFVPMD